MQLSAFDLSDPHRETSRRICRTARDNGQRQRVVVRQPHVHKHLQNDKKCSLKESFKFLKTRMKLQG